eukprot:15316819-Alexandrium_andersonii.AAC.1
MRRTSTRVRTACCTSSRAASRAASDPTTRGARRGTWGSPSASRDLSLDPASSRCTWSRKPPSSGTTS